MGFRACSRPTTSSLSSRTEGDLSLIPHLRYHLSGHSHASLPSTTLTHLTPLSSLSLLWQRLQPLLNSELSFLFEPFHPTLALVHVNNVRSRLLPGHLLLAEQVRYRLCEHLSPQSWRLGKQKWQTLPLAWPQPVRVCDQVWSTSLEALWGWFMLLESLVSVFWLAACLVINKHWVKSCWSIRRFCNHSLCIWLEIQFQVYTGAGVVPSWATPLWGFLTQKTQTKCRTLNPCWHCTLAAAFNLLAFTEFRSSPGAQLPCDCSWKRRGNGAVGNSIQGCRLRVKRDTAVSLRLWFSWL